MFGLGRPHGASGLEALPAKDRPALSRPKRNGGLLAALRTGCLGFRAHRPAAPATRRFGAFGFAGLATLGFVLKALVGEEHLFAGGEDKLGATFRTLQDLVVEFHGRFPLDPFRAVGGPTLPSPRARTKPGTCSGDTGRVSSG